MGESGLARLYAELVEAERDLCRRSLWAHIEIACEKTFDPVVHGDMIAAWESGDWNELLWLMARGHFKSTLLACCITWEVGKNRNFTGIIVSAILGTGGDTVFLVKQLLERPSMVRIWGDFKGDSVWNNEELVVSGRTEDLRESTLKAMSLESFRPGGHYDLVWFDDPEDQKTTNTPELRAITRRNYALSKPMADKPGARRGVSGTFWDDDDLYCHLVVKYGLGHFDEEAGELVMVNGTRSKDGRKWLIFKPAEDQDGKILFPSRFSRDFLDSTREEMEFLSPGSYDKQYLLNPVPKKNARFRAEDHLTIEQVPTTNMAVSFGMDFAQSKTEGSDRSAVVGLFHTPEYLFYVFEASELKLDAEAQQNAIFDRHAAFPHARFYAEADNFVKGWIPQFEARCRQKGIFPIIEWIDAGARAKKDDRIFATEGLFRMKRVLFLPGTSLLWSQLSRMPASRRKDVADAFANVVQYHVPQIGGAAFSGVRKPLRGYEKIAQACSGTPPWNESGTSAETPYAGKRGDTVPWAAS